MRILVVTQYFWPEHFIVNDLVRKLEAMGHFVTVATGKPNYPSGEIAPGYSRSGTQEEIFGKAVRVVRVPLQPRRRGRATDLIRNYLSFLISASLRFPYLLRGASYDVVFVFAVSPITSAIPAIGLNFLKRAHLVLWVQDLWPESLVATGFVRNRFILKAIDWMVWGIYRAADTILVQSAAFIKPISRYVPPDRIELFANFAPADDGAASQGLPVPVKALFDGRFCVVFAGNLGKAQGLDTIVEAAACLRDNADIRIILAGSGTAAADVDRAVEMRNLSNICRTGQLDAASMPDLFAHADALLITLRDDAAMNATVPSKLQAYMKAGKPIVGSVNGEAARIIDDAGAGIVVAAGDAAQLAAAILTLARMSANKRATLGQNARGYFRLHFEVEAATQRVMTILESRMKKAKGF